MENPFDDYNIEIKKLKNIIGAQKELLCEIAIAIINLTQEIIEYEKDIYNTNQIKPRKK